MHKEGFRVLVCLLISFGLVSCRNANSVSVATCANVPQTMVSQDMPNTVDLIIQDMTLSHQGLPHGVPESYNWAKGPVSETQSVPERLGAMVAWGQVYEDICGNPAQNTRVQIRDIRAYALSKRDNQWHLLQSSIQVEGAAYWESFVPHISKAADVRVEKDSSISVKAGGGFNFHFWTPTRALIQPEDIAGIFTTIQARLVIDDPSLPDDRFKARYLLNMGADLWRDTTIDFDKEENNPDLGMGRFKYVTTGWQSFNMLYVVGGIDENVFRENPPPLNNTGG